MSTHKYNKSFSRVLLLILVLVAGQIESEIVYSCMASNDITTHNAMTDMGMQQESCLGLDSEDNLSLVFTHELQQNTPVLDLTGESEVDPAKLIFTSHTSVFKQHTASTSSTFHHTSPALSGSNNYLITRRLRI